MWRQPAHPAATIEQREQHLAHHILPLIGPGTTLPKIDVDRFRDELARTRSPAMAKKVWTSFRAILKLAKVAHLAADVDPIRVAGRNREAARARTRYPDPGRSQGAGRRRRRLRQGADRDFGVRGLADLGSAGVALAGRRSQGGRFDVRQRATKWNAFSPLKSDTSYQGDSDDPARGKHARGVPRSHLPRSKVLAFATRSGTVQSQANVWNWAPTPLQVAAGVVDRDGKAKYGAHALRHFFASWRLDQGDNVKQVSVLCGHSSPVVTLTRTRI